MKSIADLLPPEIARQIHPDRRKNEAAYWAVPDQLLDQYRGQWIGFAEGKLIASGTSPVTVFHAAEATGLHPFFICVGREEEPCRIRRAASPFDASYPGESLNQGMGSDTWGGPEAPVPSGKPQSPWLFPVLLGQSDSEAGQLPLRRPDCRRPGSARVRERHRIRDAIPNR